MKSLRASTVMMVVAFVIPTIPIYRSAEAYPKEFLESDESTSSSDPSWQLGQLLDRTDEIDAHRREEALENLQKMFGIRSQTEKKSTRHETPPQFMMELYRTIADPSGVTRGKNPYDAKIVRSFIERDGWPRHLYLFDISGLETNESVLEAELHLYRKRATLEVVHPKTLSSPYYLIRVYQVLEGKRTNEPDLHRLLNVRYVGARASGWQVFNVKQAVLAWVSGAPNLGLLVTASTLFGDDVSIEFSRRNDRRRSEQPILVLFDDDAEGEVSEAAENIVPRYLAYDEDPEEEALASGSDVDDDSSDEEENVDSSEDSVAREDLRRLKREEEYEIDEATNKVYKSIGLNKEQSYGTQLGNDHPTDSTEYLQRHKRIARRRSSREDEERSTRLRSLYVDEDNKITVSNLFRPSREALADENRRKRLAENFVSDRRFGAPGVLGSMAIHERVALRERTEERDPRHVGRKERRRGRREKRSTRRRSLYVDEDNKITVSNLFRPSREALADENRRKRLAENFVSDRRFGAPGVLGSMAIHERVALRERTEERDPRHVGRKDRLRGRREKRSTKGTVRAEERSRSHANTRENATECGRHELYVDFKEIGLSSSIIAPRGYSAYHCQGPCESPLSQDQQPTNHATVQGIVHKMGLVNDVHMPCCVPTKLLSTTILFFDDNENVVLKVYEDMIAERCGCR